MSDGKQQEARGMMISDSKKQAEHERLMHQASQPTSQPQQPGEAAPEKVTLRDVLKEHFLFAIECEHETKLDRAVCACSKLQLPQSGSVIGAVEYWINHVMEEAEAALSSEAQPPKRDLSIPTCPQCGLEATYRAPYGKQEFYCPNAHYWLSSEAGGEPQPKPFNNMLELNRLAAEPAKGQPEQDKETK
jgi:hypothetical protein